MKEQMRFEFSEDEPSSPSGRSSMAGEFEYTPGAEDVQLPYIRLAQGLTPEVSEGRARPGQWILPDGSLADAITGLVIGMRKVRRYQEDQDLLCRSMDAVIGVGNPGGSCEECPLSKWTPGQGGKNIPPKCTLGYQYLIEYGDANNRGIGVINMSTKSASRAAAQLNMYIRIYGAKNFLVTLGSAAVVKGPRKFHVPTLIGVTSLRKQLTQAE